MAQPINLSRRPPGLTKAIEAAILSRVPPETAAVEAYATGAPGDHAEVEAWLAENPNFDARSVWWVLARRDLLAETKPEAKPERTLPNATRRPAGLKRAIEKAILAQSPPPLEDVEAAILGTADGAAVQSWLKANGGLPIEYLWWTLQRHRMETAAAQANETDSAAAKLMKILRKRYVYGAFVDSLWDRQARAWITPSALNNYWIHTLEPDDSPPFLMFRDDPKTLRVHYEKYVPGCEDEITEVDGATWLNTWQPYPVAPKKGDASPMLDHLLYLCNGNKGQAAHVLDWLAYAYQNPGKKIHHAVLIISEAQGTGKDTLAQSMERVIGHSNVATIQDDALAEGRNHFMKAAQIVVAPEVMTSDRRGIANKLKPLITQPKIEINEKFVRQHTVTNHSNFLMFSQHENAAHIEDKDRRFYVVICRQDPKPQQYYLDLYAYLDDPERVSAWAHVLETRDLSAFNPAAHPPANDDKAIVQRATRSGIESWLEDALESRGAGLDVDVINLREAVAAIAKDGGPKMTVQQLSAWLSRHGGVDLGPKRLPNLGQKRLWAIRDAETVQTLPPAVIEDLHEGRTKSAHYRMRVVAAAE